MYNSAQRHAKHIKHYWTPRLTLLAVLVAVLWYHPMFLEDVAAARRAKRRAQQRLAAQKRRVANVEAHRAKERAKAQAYRKNHPENMHKLDSLYHAKRRARIANAPAVENVDLDVIYARDKRTCQLCHKRIKRSQASRDHIIPLSKGGAHTYQNVVLACISCNAIKRDQDFQQQMRLF